ncbi:hypothetical protein ADUPG1_007790, partial [Aduncisulcus paluster]
MIVVIFDILIFLLCVGVLRNKIVTKYGDSRGRILSKSIFRNNTIRKKQDNKRLIKDGVREDELRRKRREEEEEFFKQRREEIERKIIEEEERQKIREETEKKRRMEEE